MNPEHRKTVLIAAMILLSSCGSDMDNADLSVENAIPEYELAVVDSFGVEIGDSISMIGSINGFCCHPDGSILLLDGMYRKVKVFTDTEEIICWGSTGEGPGEFLSPRGICAMQDGRILISDQYKLEVMEYDISGQYTGSYLTGERKIPSNIMQVDSNSIVGTIFDAEISDGQLQGVFYYIGRFDSNSNPSVKYFEIHSDMSDAAIYTELDMLDFQTSPSGRVFIVPDNTDYNIIVYSIDGSIEYEISPDVERLEKSTDQIQSEIDEFESNAVGDRAYTGGYQPSPYYQLISLAGVDSENNLWVQRYVSEAEYHIDVWDSTGNLAYTVSLQEFEYNPDLVFHVDCYGILGAIVDSDVYPRIYSFEIVN